MHTNLIHSFEKGKLSWEIFDLPELQSHQFIIKTKYCGICRNDIGAYMDQAFRMPLGRQGHEGVGLIVRVHEKYNGKFKVGDIVSTFDSDPCFGEFYLSDDSKTVLIPELSPKYIMEPIACALNILIKTITTVIGTTQQDVLQPKILLIGSGFMSLLIKQYCDYLGIEIEVAGTHHREHWKKFDINLKPFRFYIDKSETFNAVIDLSGHMNYYPQIVSKLTEVGATICFASTPHEDIILDFNASAWKDLTYVFPSPRSISFIDIMELGVKLIKENILETEFLWTKGYKFDDIHECKQGFEDGVNRSENYLKGYIQF